MKTISELCNFRSYKKKRFWKLFANDRNGQNVICEVKSCYFCFESSWMRKYWFCYFELWSWCRIYLQWDWQFHSMCLCMCMCNVAYHGVPTMNHAAAHSTAFNNLKWIMRMVTHPQTVIIIHWMVATANISGRKIIAKLFGRFISMSQHLRFKLQCSNTQKETCRPDFPCKMWYINE